MRTKSATLVTAEKSVTSTPIISIVISNGTTTYTYSTTDSPNRVKYIKHFEKPYDDGAVVILGNSDKTLPSSLAGYRVDISYGYRVSGVNYFPDPPYCAPLWVKKQYQISMQGDISMVLYLEGAWKVLAETEYIASLVSAAAAPYYDIDYSAGGYTVYDIIKSTLAGMSFNLAALGIHDDSIIDTLLPKFMVNYQGSVESAIEVIYRLLNMTKCFMRAESLSGVTVTSALIATGSNSSSMQRKIFYVLGLYWAFYYVGTGFYLKTSADGVTWSAATLIKTVPGSSDGKEMDFFVESRGGVTYLHYAFADGTSVLYRRGTMSSGGAISWDAAEQTVEVAGIAVGYPVIAVDTNGYAVVGYVHVTVITVAHWHGHVNANNDGTWATANNTDLSGSAVSWGGVCAPTSDGKVVMIYGPQATSKVRGRVWNGAAWSAEDTSDSNLRYTGSGVPFSVLCVSTVAHIAFETSSLTMVCLTMDSATALFSSETAIVTGLDSGTEAADYPIVSKDSANNIYCLWYMTSKHVYYSKRDAIAGTWGAAVDCGLFDIKATGKNYYWSGFATLPNIAGIDYLFFVYQTAAGALRMVNDLPAYYKVLFRIIYPNAWTSFHSTYTSDRPDATYHQFKEFEWQDHILLPTHVIVVANRVDKADGTWDETEIKLGDYSITPEGGYSPILQYHLAESLATEAAADTRAEVIAKRQWMEEALGRVLVQHDCGLELYDYIQIEDKRGAVAYADYPPTKWSTTYGKICVVGSLVHTFQADAGIYTLEITLNGIDSALPVYEVAKPKPVTPAAVGDFGFIGGVGSSPPIVNKTTIQPFQPILNPADYGGSGAAWNMMLDLMTGGSKTRKNITIQAIDWGNKVSSSIDTSGTRWNSILVSEYEKLAAKRPLTAEEQKKYQTAKDWVRLNTGVAPTSSPVQSPTTPTTPVAPTTPATPVVWSARKPGESLIMWLRRLGRR